MHSTGSDVGFDDLFDRASFRTTLHLSQPSQRPQKWPKGATQMRRHTDYGGQGIARLGDGDAHYRQISQRQPPAAVNRVKILAKVTQAPRAAPQRAAGGAKAPPQPSADRRQWTWSDTSSA